MQCIAKVHTKHLNSHVEHVRKRVSNCLRALETWRDSFSFVFAPSDVHVTRDHAAPPVGITNRPTCRRSPGFWFKSQGLFHISQTIFLAADDADAWHRCRHRHRRRRSWWLPAQCHCRPPALTAAETDDVKGWKSFLQFSCEHYGNSQRGEVRKRKYKLSWMQSDEIFLGSSLNAELNVQQLGNKFWWTVREEWGLIHTYRWECSNMQINFIYLSFESRML